MVEQQNRIILYCRQDRPCKNCQAASACREISVISHRAAELAERGKQYFPYCLQVTRLVESFSLFGRQEYKHPYFANEVKNSILATLLALVPPDPDYSAAPDKPEHSHFSYSSDRKNGVRKVPRRRGCP